MFWLLVYQIFSSVFSRIHQFSVGLFDGIINNDIFHGWVEELLLLELPNNSVIVMDNGTLHKRKDTQQIIEANSHEILWLLPYSPDLNPIEQTWAWIKKKRQE